MKAFTAILACAGAVYAQQQSESLTDVLSNNNETSALATLLESNQELVQALSQAGNNITVLAPSNEAIERFTSENNETIQSNPGLVAATLQYHILNGSYTADQILNASEPLFVRTFLADEDDFEQVEGGQYVQVQGLDGEVTIVGGLLQNASVTTPDLNFTGGIIHIINEVLTLPANVTETATQAGLSSLAGALTLAEFLDDINDADNVTIFAPTNMAFQNINSSLSEAGDQLDDILQYHVVGNAVLFSTEIENGTEVETLDGGSVTLRMVGDNLFVNGALITIPNILVENGVIHVIDQVLNPANATAAPAEDATEGSVQFEGAEAGSEPPLTSGIPTPTSTIAPRPTGTGSDQTPPGSTSSGVAGNVKANVPALLLAAGAFLL